MDPEVADVAQSGKSPVPVEERQPKKPKSYTMWLMLAAVLVVIFFSIRFKRASPTKAKMTVSPDKSTTDVLPTTKYDVYQEIKQFMDRQTTYVMNN